jgi:hypothetical protein
MEWNGMKWNGMKMEPRAAAWRMETRAAAWRFNAVHQEADPYETPLRE